QVLALDPAILAQALQEGGPKSLRGRVRERWRAGQVADATRLPLRPRTRWRNNQRRTDRNELSPPHWITQGITEASASGYHVPGRMSYGEKGIRDGRAPQVRLVLELRVARLLVPSCPSQCRHRCLPALMSSSNSGRSPVFLLPRCMGL